MHQKLLESLAHGPHSKLPLEDLKSAIAYLKSEGFVRPDRIGVTGFCAGGANTYMLAFNSREIAAAAPFYGAPPLPIPDLANVCPLCVFLGDLDRGTNANIPALLSAAYSLNKSMEVHQYAGARHAFMNDTGAAFNAEAACDGWNKAIAFFRRELFKA